uniref:Uncharacterized protein n=1 Tax=viral metagenome TaxID=1070528 RepID=A0A6C0BQU1_9ZZZZ
MNATLGGILLGLSIALIIWVIIWVVIPWANRIDPICKMRTWTAACGGEGEPGQWTPEQYDMMVDAITDLVKSVESDNEDCLERAKNIAEEVVQQLEDKENFYELTFSLLEEDEATVKYVSNLIVVACQAKLPQLWR